MATSRDYHAGDPPESTQLRIGDIAWSDINGVYDREDSLKENTNPKCLLKNHPAAAHTSASQRFSGNLKPTAASIIGLPGKLVQGGGGCARRHHPPAMFPKKAKTGGGGRNPKAAVPEPGSPKVSCIGKVLSDRERALRRRPPRPPGTRPGCCGGFGFLMRRSRSRNSAVECVDQSPPPPPPPMLAAAAARRRETKELEVPPVSAPGLGGMRRFASGRRSADWAAEMEEDGRVAMSGPL
ncbi:uncharacterized protein LOC133900463 [Phragmites australis]|uniref:uncharacterized protein LOC133900463 n=1 Tax=Phragmites australis TaxID=29695 RepID=UPI002D788361|nr:uncharacterized protein LOC133900463 [Phragmites australis]